MGAENDSCWRASLMYKNENNKLVLNRQNRNVPKCRLLTTFKTKGSSPQKDCIPSKKISENQYK
jgi:hypothetical protein